MQKKSLVVLTILLFGFLLLVFPESAVAAEPGDTVQIEVPFSFQEGVYLLQIELTLSPGLTLVDANYPEIPLNSLKQDRVVFLSMTEIKFVKEGKIILQVSVNPDAVGEQRVEIREVLGANDTYKGNSEPPQPVVIPVLSQETWGEWFLLKAVTCTQDGVRERTSSLGNRQREILDAPGHVWEDWRLFSVPTCAQPGQEERSCRLCGKTETREIPASDHIWGDWQIQTPATCGETGLEERTCVFCGAAETREIPALGHNWSEWHTLIPPTCADGLEERICLNDPAHRETRAVSAILLHTFSEWYLSEPPTCTKTGLEKRTCSLCGKTETREVPALDHQWSKWKTLTPATCETTGIEERVCSYCGAKESRMIPALGHLWSDWQTIIAPSCQDGLEERYCMRDSQHREIRGIPANGIHAFPLIGYVPVKMPTCQEPGYSEMVCEICGERWIQELPRLDDHIWSPWKTVKAARCTEIGLEKRICPFCGKTETREIPELGHKWSPWRTITAATCAQEGLEACFCLHDTLHQQTRVIPKTETHDFGPWDIVVYPTSGKEGRIERTCRICGLQESDDIPPGDHFPNPWVVTREATPERPGLRTQTCFICGALIRQEEFPLGNVRKYQEVTAAAMAPAFPQTETGLMNEGPAAILLDLTQEGQRMFPIVAPGPYRIGEVLVEIGKGTLRVDYTLLEGVKMNDASLSLRPGPGAAEESPSTDTATNWLPFAQLVNVQEEWKSNQRLMDIRLDVDFNSGMEGIEEYPYPVWNEEQGAWVPEE